MHKHRQIVHIIKKLPFLFIPERFFFANLLHLFPQLNKPEA